MSLNDIFCQDRGVSLLQRAFAADRVPHAYIFAGPEGVGKFKTAMEWGRLLLCKNPIVGEEGGDSVDSCGTCESCLAVEGNSHPDFNIIYKELLEFTKDGKDKTAPIDMPIAVIREFLLEKISTRPTLSERKVFIVSEAEKLNNSSQNCLLKVLEEPPGHCCIILLCTRLEKLLQTTRSRCQVVRFGPIDEDIIVEKLRETGLGREPGLYFARLSQGSLGLACRWGELELSGAGLYDIKKGVVDSVVGLEYATIPELAGRFVEKSKAIATAWSDVEKGTSKKDISRMAAKSVVRIVMSVLYDAMKADIEPGNGAINSDQKRRIEELARRFAAEELASKVADCYEILRWIEAGVNEKLVFEQLLFNLASSDRMSV